MFIFRNSFLWNIYSNDSFMACLMKYTRLTSLYFYVNKVDPYLITMFRRVSHCHATFAVCGPICVDHFVRFLLKTL